MNTLVIIPKNVYDDNNVKEHITKLLLPYKDNEDCEPYVLLPAEEFLELYNGDQDKECYDTIEEYCAKIFGGVLDENKNVISTTNEKLNNYAFWNIWEFSETELLPQSGEMSCYIEHKCELVKDLLKSYNEYEQKFKIVVESDEVVFRKQSSTNFDNKVTKMLEDNIDGYFVWLTCFI